MTLCLLKAGSIPAVSLNVYEREGQGDGQCRGELARQFLKRFRKKMRGRANTVREHSMIQVFPNDLWGGGCIAGVFFSLFFFFGEEGGGEEKFTGSYTEVNPVMAAIFGRSRTRSL